MSEIRKIKVVTENKSVTTGHKCDGCGIVVDGDLPNDWLQLSAHHEEWGNDSVDSWEYRDVCSPACFVLVSERLLTDFKGYERSAEIAGMPYAFIKKMVDHIKSSHNPPAQ